MHDARVRQLLVSALGKWDILPFVQILKLHHLMMIPQTEISIAAICDIWSVSPVQLLERQCE